MAMVCTWLLSIVSCSCSWLYSLCIFLLWFRTYWRVVLPSIWCGRLLSWCMLVKTRGTETLKWCVLYLHCRPLLLVALNSIMTTSSKEDCRGWNKVYMVAWSIVLAFLILIGHLRNMAGQNELCSYYNVPEVSKGVNETPHFKRYLPLPCFCWCTLYE